MKKAFLTLALIGASTIALAQNTINKVGGFQLDTTTTTLIGAGLGIVVSPITALTKKWFHTEGITTQLVHAGLSTLITAGIGYSQGAFGPGWQGAGQAALAAFATFLVGLGQYTRNKQAAEGAAK